MNDGLWVCGNADAGASYQTLTSKIAQENPGWTEHDTKAFVNTALV